MAKSDSVLAPESKRGSETSLGIVGKLGYLIFVQITRVSCLLLGMIVND